MAKGYNMPTRQLVSQQDAAMIERANIPRSKFTGSWSRITAFDAGILTPILVDEILPGDHVRYDVTAYVRMSTPLFPLFSNQRVDTFFFFVPCRLVWDNWTKMMGEQADPDSSIDFTVPIVEADSPQSIGGIVDHFGLPYLTGLVPNDSEWWANALPFRAYNLIWNEWFRDENVTDSITVPRDNGPDSLSNYALKYRMKSADYFTSALPWAQKFTAPTVSLGGLAPIIGFGSANQNPGNGPGAIGAWETGDTYPDFATYQYAKSLDSADVNNAMWVRMVDDGTGPTGRYSPAVYADLQEATGIAINTFRQAYMVQTLLERDARGGTRYTEQIRAQFGVINPDFRLQRPEYIGGGQSPLAITAIAQTAPTEDAPLGALGAAGTSGGQHSASYAATEHGYIIGLINVKSELSYQQGKHKMWSRLTRYDFYTPALALLGEQAIARREIYAQGDNYSDTVTFGYQEHWHEYRTRMSEVTGIMRSDAAGTLDAWHLAQDFDTAPVLDSTFLADTPPMARVLAAGSLAVGQQYLADILFRRSIVRPMPTFSTPATLGRF